jgi:hypothetical protein
VRRNQHVERPDRPAATLQMRADHPTAHGRLVVVGRDFKREQELPERACILRLPELRAAP